MAWISPHVKQWSELVQKLLREPCHGHKHAELEHVQNPLTVSGKSTSTQTHLSNFCWRFMTQNAVSNPEPKDKIWHGCPRALHASKNAEIMLLTARTRAKYPRLMRAVRVGT